MKKSPKNLGKLPPQYNFFLNPYGDLRFTRCPQCSGKAGQRKVPLVIHVDPNHPVSINYTCRYCPSCDLLIAHQDKIERLLTALFEQHAPEVIGNDYLVLGTFDREFWKQGTKTPHTIQAMVEHLHDFKQVIKFELHYGWEREETKEESAQYRAPDKRPAKSLKGKPANLSIDDYESARRLVEKMKASLPIPARPTRELVKILKRQGVSLDRYRDVQIKQIFSGGDEGGITCDITPPGKEKAPILCSLTHLEIKGADPLAQEIRAYQETRIRKIAQQGGSSAGITIKPRKKR